MGGDLPDARDAAGQITARAVEQALREDTALIALTLVNNEVGTVLPMAEIAALLRRRQSRALVYLDAVQGLGRLKLEPHAWGVAAMAVSGHKIGAPKGVGALYVKKGLRLPPLLLGGGQEGGPPLGHPGDARHRRLRRRLPAAAGDAGGERAAGGAAARLSRRGDRPPFPLRGAKRRRGRAPCGQRLLPRL